MRRERVNPFHAPAGGGGLRGAAVALVIMGAAAGLPSKAAATSACGAVITNAVISSMWSVQNIVFLQLTYNASAYVQVVCPLVALTKRGPWPEASSGTTFAFTVCLENQTKDSVWNVTITDAMPPDMAFRGWPYNVWTGGNYQTSGSAPTLSQTYSASLAGPWTAGTPPDGQTAPVYLRWNVGFVGPSRSACVTFSVEIL